MDEAKKKQLEEELKRLFAAEDAAQETPSRPKEARSGRVRVIRRRKGAPDLQIT